MLVRVLRVALGTILLLLGLPFLLAGGLLHYALQHQHPTGGFTGSLAPITTDGHAVVALDLDGLLRQAAPFARSEQTVLRLTAETGAGQPAFLGLAPASEVADYLAGVRHTRVEQVQLARGQLPASTVGVWGGRAPAGPPAEQSFWLASSDRGTLEWQPREFVGQQLALVVMAMDGAEPRSVQLSAQVLPQWLVPTTYGLLVLGGVLVLVALVVLVWPGRSPRQVVYLVPPHQLPEVAAQLGVPVPRDPPAAPDPHPPGRLPAENPDPTPPAPVEWPLRSVMEITATPVAVPRRRAAADRAEAGTSPSALIAGK